MTKIATITSNKVKKKTTIVGEAVAFVTESKEIIFVEGGDSVVLAKGDVIFTFDTSLALPKYVYYYLQNMQNTEREQFTHLV